MSTFPFEIRIFHILIGAFALVVLVAGYYVVGGPVRTSSPLMGKLERPFRGAMWSRDNPKPRPRKHLRLPETALRAPTPLPFLRGPRETPTS